MLSDALAGLNSRGAALDEEAEDLDRSKDCCMQHMLSMEQDFRNEKPLLQIVIERAGHKCIFLPKFHCELNPIEMVWGQGKRGEFHHLEYHMYLIVFGTRISRTC